MDLETINAFQTDYGVLWIDNSLEMVRFDGETHYVGLAWDQFCRHVLALLGGRPRPRKLTWRERLRALFLGR